MQTIASKAPRAASNRPSSTVRLNVCNGARDKFPEQIDLPSFAEASRLIESLVAGAVRSDKRACPGFNFGMLTAPKNVNANTAAVTALAIDVDSGPDGAPLDLGALLVALENGKVEALIYESASSTDDLPRVRICASLSRPIAPDEVKHARRTFAELLGIGPGQGVETAEAVSQIFFAGRLEGTRERKVMHFAGTPLDADGLAATVLKGQWKRITRMTEAVDASGLPRGRRACVTDYDICLKEGDTEISNARYKYCIEGAKRGLNAEQIMDRMREVYLPRHDVETSDERLEKDTMNALALIHGDPESRSHAQAYGGFLAWERRREKQRQKRYWAEKISGWKSKREAAAKPVNDTENDDPFTALGTDPGIDSAYEPTDWLIEGLQLAPGKMSLITAYAGGSKTPFAALTSLCVASGHELLGRKVRRERVLYMAFEGGRNARRKMVRIGKGLGLDVRQLIAGGWLTVLDAKALDPDTAAELVERAITCKRLGLVVTDTVTSALRGVDAARNEERYARLLFDLGNVSERTGCTILGLAHDNKSASGSNSRGVSGTSSILEAAQVVIRLEPAESDPCKIKVTCVRALDQPFEAFHVRWVDGTEEQTRGQAMLPVTIDTPLRCVIDAPPPVKTVTNGKQSDNAQRAAQKRQAVEQTMQRVILALVSTGSASIDSLQREAGDVSKRVVDEAMARLKGAGAIVKAYDQARLTDKLTEFSEEEIEEQLLALSAVERLAPSLH